MSHVTALSPFALGTFSAAGGPAFPGIILNDEVIAIEALRTLCLDLGCGLPESSGMFELLQDWSTTIRALTAAVNRLVLSQLDTADIRAKFVPVERLRVHAPLDRPRQVICSGANYFKHVVDLIVAAGPGDSPDTQGFSPEQLREHAETIMKERSRTGDPYMFSKPAACITGPYDPILISPHTKKADWELELAVVIGKAGRHISREDALGHVAGYTIANDITNRDQIWRRDDMKAMGTDWIAGKSSPTYLPLGPYLVPSAFVEDPQNLRLTLKLNAEVKQDESTSDMIFDVARQIEYLSSLVQLNPGDILCTGSPAGNGAHFNRFLQHGDIVESTITGLGTQRNTCLVEGVDK